MCPATSWLTYQFSMTQYLSNFSRQQGSENTAGRVGELSRDPVQLETETRGCMLPGGTGHSRPASSAPVSTAFAMRLWVSSHRRAENISLSHSFALSHTTALAKGMSPKTQRWSCSAQISFPGKTCYPAGGSGGHRQIAAAIPAEAASVAKPQCPELCPSYVPLT